MILWIVLAVLILLVCALGFALASYSMGIKGQTLEEARKWQSDHYDMSFYDTMPREDYEVRSYDGYVLHVHLLRCEKPSGRYVILSHGYTDNHIGSLKYARIYLSLGFHVVLYDLRGHGENEKTFCTYSVRESHDLACVIEDTRRRYADDLRTLGIHGESLGSASSIACLKYHPDIAFVVADCGFSEITSVMAAGLRGMHLPACLVHLASVCAKIRFGYAYHQMRPIDSLSGNKVPILFIHGEKDTFIPPVHSQRMQKATAGYSEIHLIPDAPHAASVLTAPAMYRDIVSSFFTSIQVPHD